MIVTRARKAILNRRDFLKLIGGTVLGAALAHLTQLAYAQAMPYVSPDSVISKDSAKSLSIKVILDDKYAIMIDEDGKEVFENTNHARVINEALNTSYERIVDKWGEQIAVAAWVNRGGGIVKLAPGKFLISEPIIVPPSTVLEGSGRSQTLLKVVSSMDYVIGLKEPATGQEIRDLAIKCDNGLAKDGISVRFTSPGTRFVRIKNVIISPTDESKLGVAEYGIYLGYQSPSFSELHWIEDVLVTRCGKTGVYVTGNHNVIIKVKSANNEEDGFYVEGFDSVIIACAGVGNKRYGFNIGDGIFGIGLYAEANVEKDFYFRSWKAGVFAARSPITIARSSDDRNFFLCDGHVWFMSDQQLLIPNYTYDSEKGYYVLSGYSVGAHFRRNWVMKLGNVKVSGTTFTPDTDKLASLGDEYRRWRALYVAGKVKYMAPIASGKVSVPAGGEVTFYDFTVPTGKTLIIHSAFLHYNPSGVVKLQILNVTDNEVIVELDSTTPFDDTGWEISEGKQIVAKLVNPDSAAAHEAAATIHVSVV